jgi:hypothetical protein
MLIRTQMKFPATGEVLAPFAAGHFVAGGMRGSHNMPLMPVPLGATTGYFDGPPLVTCAAFCVYEGRLTEPLDAFAHRFWDAVRHDLAHKGGGDAPAGLLRGGHVADGRTRIHGHHREVRRARSGVQSAVAGQGTRPDGRLSRRQQRAISCKACLEAVARRA